MSNEILEEYSSAIRRLKEQYNEAGMTDEDFRKLYFETLQSLERPQNSTTLSTNRLKKIAVLLSLFFLILAVIVKVKTLYSCTACNLQDFIYPGLRLLRKISIPIISLFPSLTALYYDTCLIQNPFFTVVDMDCWPCSNINTVREIYEPLPTTEQNNAPFIYQTDQNVINIESLASFYLNNKDLLDKEASKIISGTKAYIQPSDMFHQHKYGEKNSYIWKFSNMNVAKALRQLIPRPKIVPKFGQSTERFVIVDTSQEIFRIPDTECNFSFLLALSGARTVNLIPAEECQLQCKTLEVKLQETYLVWYNWWYWRPVIEASSGNTTFIAHVGSYC